MALRLLTFSYASARARALAAGLLPSVEIEELLSSPTISQAERSLDRLSGVALGTDAAGLYGSFLNFGNKVARSLPAAARQLVRAYLSRCDIENLKVICRAILTDRRDLIDRSLLPAGPDNIVTDPMRTGRSLDELAARLPPGAIRSALRTGLATAPHERLYVLDSGLEFAFWSRLRERVDELPRFDRLAALEILGMRADVDRFRVVGRGLQAALPAATILATLPPFGTRLPRDAVRRALQAPDPVAVLNRLAAATNQSPGAETRGEVSLFRRLYRHLQRTLRSAPFDISVALSALLLKELELRDLHVVLSGLRLDTGRDEMAAVLSFGGE